MRIFWMCQEANHILLKKLTVNPCEILQLSFCCMVGPVEVNVNLKVGVVHCLARGSKNSSLYCFSVGLLNAFHKRTKCTNLC